MRKFKVEHKDYDKPSIIVTIFNPPYNKEAILSRTKWKLKDCTITEVKQYEGEE